MSQAAPANEPSLADRLRGVEVSARSDLEVTRHVVQGGVSYVITDPVSFDSHALDPEDYWILGAIRSGRTLGATFDELVAAGALGPEDEDDFYRFVLSLHGSNLLVLPVSTHAALTERLRRARRRDRLGLWRLPFFYKVPLVDPDRFLQSTQRWVRPLFGRTAFVIWCVLVAMAILVGISEREAVQVAASGLFEPASLASLWIVFVVLKIVHEFGHAYACRLFGGRVPEMGACVIVMTPCAYVNASSAWTFPERWRRVVVSLAGMYVELAIAAAALIAWSMMPPGGARGILFQAALAGSVTTVAFNLNPLMRFDGYYVLSDLLRIPNLQARAFGAVRALAKRLLLGLRVDEARDAEIRGTLLTYGIAVSVYRVALVIGIAMLLAQRFGWIGLMLAVTYVVVTVGSMLIRTVAYLWRSSESSPVRGRAIAWSVILLVGVPALVGMAPLPATMVVEAVTRPTELVPVSARSGGLMIAVDGEDGRRLQEGDVIATLVDPAADAALHEADALVAEARVRLQEARARPDGGVDAAQAASELAWLARLRDERQAESERLTVRAEHAGILALDPAFEHPGRFVETGGVFGAIGSGRVRLQLVLDADRLAAARPEVGMTVACRLASAPAVVHEGTIVSVDEIGQRAIDEAGLTRASGGSIAVDANGMAAEAHFEVVVELPLWTEDVQRWGERAWVRIDATDETIGRLVMRRLRTFANRLVVG